jgi:hypothetical protein
VPARHCEIDLRDAISSPLRSQPQALLPGFLGRIDLLLLYGELYGPLSSLDSPEWPHLMSRVLRFHDAVLDAVYINHRSTFWSFPLKEQLDGQQQGPLTDKIMPDLDDASDDTDDESL